MPAMAWGLVGSAARTRFSISSASLSLPSLMRVSALARVLLGWLACSTGSTTGLLLQADASEDERARATYGARGTSRKRSYHGRPGAIATPWRRPHARPARLRAEMPREQAAPVGTGVRAARRRPGSRLRAPGEAGLSSLLRRSAQGRDRALGRAPPQRGGDLAAPAGRGAARVGRPQALRRGLHLRRRATRARGGRARRVASGSRGPSRLADDAHAHRRVRVARHRAGAAARGRRSLARWRAQVRLRRAAAHLDPALPRAPSRSRDPRRPAARPDATTLPDRGPRGPRRPDLRVARSRPSCPAATTTPDLVSRQVGAADWDTHLLQAVATRPPAQLRAGRRGRTVALDAGLAVVDLRRRPGCGPAQLGRARLGGQRRGAAVLRRASPGTPDVGAGAGVGAEAEFPWIHARSVASCSGRRGWCRSATSGVRPTRQPGARRATSGLHIEARADALELEAETLAELAARDGRARAGLEFSLAAVPPCRIGGGATAGGC
jgi:hypothetical protein